MIVYSVINADYMQLGCAWARRVQDVSGVRPVFVCADQESQDFLSGEDFPCVARPPSSALSTDKKLVYRQSSFPNDDAAYTVSLKMRVASDYLADGQEILYSDVDAVWLKDPIGEMTAIDADLIFQPGSFPRVTKADWGFSVCSGLFYMRPCTATMYLAEQVTMRFDGSDQRTLNHVLQSDFDVRWETRPTDWEHTSLTSGWIAPIRGVCAVTGLSLGALPHSYYQRHGTTAEATRHAVICHPNSPKDQDRKFETFEALGIALR